MSGIKGEYNEKHEELMAALARKNSALHQIGRIEQEYDRFCTRLVIAALTPGPL
jgi:hypothetical protein